MRFHTALDIREPGDVDQVCRISHLLSEPLGLSSDALSRAILVGSDLCAYLAMQPGGGRLLTTMVEVEDGSYLVEFVAISERDPTRGSLTGQAAAAPVLPTGPSLDRVRQHSSVFDSYAVLSGGCVVVSRVGRSTLGKPLREVSPIAFGGICIPIEGEKVSGDAWSVVTGGSCASVFVADGLGHGPEAAAASRAAVETFRAAPFTPPSQLLLKAHAALRSTRGAVVGMAHADLANRAINFCGAGNIAGRIISGVQDRSVISQPGTVGVAIRTLIDVRYSWPEHALLILHSDGISSRWDFSNAHGLMNHHPTLIAAWILLNHARGRDDATVVVVVKRRQA